MFAIVFPQIDPILLDLGLLQIKWYGVAYAVSLIIGIYLLQKLSIQKSIRYGANLITSKQLDSLMMYMITGMILGGRLGFVSFYKPYWFIERPLMVLNTIEGGMSFHGAFIGMLISLIIFCKKNKLLFFAMSDLICVVAPIGLFFGRCANFINSELYGRITNCRLGVIFPNGGPLLRHPSQLYEAMLEGIVLFLLMIILFFKTNLPATNGFLTGIFMIGYAVARVTVEEFREPDLYIGYITIGQALTIPMFIGGLLIIKFTKKQL